MERGIPVRSVSRSIYILQVLNLYGAMSLMEIAKAVNLPYPTTCRLVQTLIHEGLVECEQVRKHYRVTALVQSLSTGFQPQDQLVAVARPHIEAFTRKTYWPLGITTHVGQSMVVRDSTNAETSLTFTNFHPGFVFPLLGSACGHAFLAFCSDTERENILKGIELHEGRSLTLSMFESGKLPQRIREDGYAVYAKSPHTPTPGKTSSLAVPIFKDGVALAALTMTIFASAMTMEEAVRRYLGDLQEAARLISRDMSGAAPVGASGGASAGAAAPVQAALLGEATARDLAPAPLH